MYKNTYILYNPYAGSLRRNPALLERAEAALRAQAPWREGDIRRLPTRGPNTAGEVAREAIEQGADLILVAGGDGTVNETISGMVGSPVPLGSIPAGTANVLCMETGIGRHIERGAAQLATAVPRRISLGCIRNPAPRYFLLMAGIGLDAEIVYQLSPAFKGRWGKLAYWIAGFRQVGRSLPEFDSTLPDGTDRRTSFALITRVRNYGGDLEIARSVSLLETDFEVVLFEGRNSLRYLKYFGGILLNRLGGMPGVTVKRVAQARFACPSDSRIYIQVDGEYAGRLPVTVETVPDALTLLIPPTYAPRPHG